MVVIGCSAFDGAVATDDRLMNDVATGTQRRLREAAIPPLATTI